MHNVISIRASFIAALGLLLAGASGHAHAQQRVLFRSASGNVSFRSVAPLETIMASNSVVAAVLDGGSREFAVKVTITASDVWPSATFAGRIIEAVDPLQPGVHRVRAKGVLTIRGEARERIVPCVLTIAPDGIRVQAEMEVALADHGIRIPRVVQQKLAPVATVSVDLKLVRQQR